MTTVLSSLSEIATSLFQSFRLSFVVPALVYWTLNVLFIYPSLPEDARIYVSHLLHPLSLQPITLISIFSLLGGYFLYVLNTPIIRLFEGYPWRKSPLGVIKIALHRERQRSLDETTQTESYRKRLDGLLKAFEHISQKHSVDHPLRIKLSQQIEEAKVDLAIAQVISKRNLMLSYPVSKPPYLPTRLGNVIASFEDYPQYQYHMDAVTLWPRLVPILNREKYSIYIEREKANFDFLLNMFLISLIFCGELILAGAFFSHDIGPWIIAAGSYFVFAYFAFYKASITGALGWGNTVKVAFDLYRYQLLTALFGKTPNNFSREKDIWLNISGFYSALRSSSAKPKIDFKRVKTSMASPPQSASNESKGDSTAGKVSSETS